MVDGRLPCRRKMTADRDAVTPTTLVVVVSLLLMAIEAGTVADGVESDSCLSVCRCTSGSTVLVRCYSVGRVPVILPASTAILDLNHNHISLLTNASFTRSPAPLRSLEELRLEDNGLLHVEAGALTSLTELRVLRLGRNHLSSLPPRVFASNRKLSVLDVHANYLAALPDVVVRHLHSLTLLNASFNHLTDPTLGPGFRYTTQLSYIDLSGNDFESISSDAFEVARWWDEQVPRYINLSYCDVRHLAEHVFRPVPRLQSLSLAGNLRLRSTDLELALDGIRRPSTALEMVALSHANVSNVQSLVRRLQTATNVTRLELAYNRIQEVPQRTFFFLSGLRHLDLSHNEIRRVDGLAGLARLEYLDLSFNALEALDSEMFEGLHELRRLDVSYNAVVGELHAESLLGLFNLRSVDVSGNRISAVVVDGGGLESLDSLEAAWNRITDIRFVGHLPRLGRIDLSHNAVVRVADDVFPLGQRVEVLNLSGNAITDLGARALRQASFGTIDLSWNRLKRLDDAGWISVEVLLAHDNELEEVTDSALRVLRTSLTQLHLQRNRLQALPRSVFDDHSTTQRAAVLRVLDVSSNPLGHYVDSIERSSTSSAGLRPTLRVLRLRDVGLSRWPTGLIRGLSALNVLDVGENRLTSIPDGSLVALDRLERLDVSLNRLMRVDPVRLVSPSERPAPWMDVSGNPLDCSCALTSLCRHLFPSQIDEGETLQPRNFSTASTTSYRCRTPAEWNAVALAEFCADADRQCSSLPSAVAAASVVAVAVVVAALLAAVLCRRCIDHRRRAVIGAGTPTVGGAKAAAAAAAARCSGDGYHFVDETSLTSSSNSSSAATTTTSAVPPVPPPSRQPHLTSRSSVKLGNGSLHGHGDFLLGGPRQWL